TRDHEGVLLTLGFASCFLPLDSVGLASIDTTRTLQDSSCWSSNPPPFRGFGHRRHRFPLLVDRSRQYLLQCLSCSPFPLLISTKSTFSSTGRTCMGFRSSSRCLRLWHHQDSQGPDPRPPP
ncbi:unnamed protein product, partial [Musa acuminata var. zebrina]